MTLLLSAHSMMSDNVRNAEGQDLGSIEELMINTSTGKIDYAVLSFGGFMGLGDKYFAIPWESLTLNTADHTFILNVSKELLEDAPGFDKDNWPSSADTNWWTGVNTYYREVVR